MENGTLTPYCHVPAYGYGHGYRDNDHLGELIHANQLSNTGGQVIGAVYKATNDVIDIVNQHGLRNNDATNTAAQKLASDICNTRDAVRDEGRSNEKGFCEVRDTVRQEGRYNEQGFGRVQSQVQDEGRKTEKELCVVRDAVREEAHRTQKEIFDNARYTNDLIFREAQELKLNQKDMEHRLQLQQSQDTAALQKALAECCCELRTGQQEIKNTVLLEAGKTREDALRRELDAKTQEILLLKVSGNGPGNS